MVAALSAEEGFAIAARDELDEPVAEIRLGPEIAGGEERHDGVENDPVLVDFRTPRRQVERNEQQLLANADQLIEQLKEVIHRQPAPRRRLRPTLAGQWFLIGHIGHRAEIRGGKATSTSCRPPEVVARGALSDGGITNRPNTHGAGSPKHPSLNRVPAPRPAARPRAPKLPRPRPMAGGAL